MSSLRTFFFFRTATLFVVNFNFQYCCMTRTWQLYIWHLGVDGPHAAADSRTKSSLSKPLHRSKTRLYGSERLLRGSLFITFHVCAHAEFLTKDGHRDVGVMCKIGMTCSYGLYVYGVYTYGVYTYGVCSYDVYSYGLYVCAIGMTCPVLCCRRGAPSATADP